MEEEEFRRLSDHFDALARTRPRGCRWRVTGLVALGYAYVIATVVLLIALNLSVAALLLRLHLAALLWKVLLVQAVVTWAVLRAHRESSQRDLGAPARLDARAEEGVLEQDEALERAYLVEAWRGVDEARPLFAALAETQPEARAGLARPLRGARAHPPPLPLPRRGAGGGAPRGAAPRLLRRRVVIAARQARAGKRAARVPGAELYRRDG